MAIHSRRKILYVVDNQDHCELIRYELSNRGFVVECARTVAQAVKAAAAGAFDLYLLDNVWLMDGSGQDACRRIRSLDPNVPILFYSGHAYPKEIESALAAGADDYITLPDLDYVLPDRISALLGPGDMNSLEARREEVRAIAAELERFRFLESRVAAATAGVSDAERRFLKARASFAFIKAGGTRANFERMWPEMLEEAAGKA